MKVVAAAAVILLAVTGSKVLAAESKSANPAPAAAPKLVCSDAPRTGSNIKRRSCMTQEQAEARRREDQLATDGLKRGSAGRSSSTREQGLGRP